MYITSLSVVVFVDVYNYVYQFTIIYCYYTCFFIEFIQCSSLLLFEKSSHNDLLVIFASFLYSELSLPVYSAILCCSLPAVFLLVFIGSSGIIIHLSLFLSCKSILYYCLPGVQTFLLSISYTQRFSLLLFYELSDLFLITALDIVLYHNFYLKLCFCFTGF